MEFKDSKTYINLLTAYNEELGASAKYRIYEDIAKREGFIEIGEIYNKIAVHNKEHARIWLRKSREGSLPTTLEVLLESARQEYDRANDMYVEFAAVANEEGYSDLAALFSGVANIDFNQYDEFRALAIDVESNQVFCKSTRKLWICMQCGNVMSLECAPAICPVCGFPQGYYKLYE